MKKILFLFAISFLILSCGEQPQEEESTNPTEEQTRDELSKVGRTNYAVIWKWTTEDTQLAGDNMQIISEEFAGLWHDDVIENAYYDESPPADKLENFPNIACFLKAHSIAEADSILGTLTIVQKQIASYTLYPVGHLWLDRKSEVINEKGITKSFAVVWTTDLGKQPSDETLKAQNDKILELWNAGTIENVYFDIEGVIKENDKTDFVFFVNTDSLEEAVDICNALPFAKENLASYQIFHAGMFWLGKPLE